MRGRKPDLRAIDGGLSDVPPPPTWLPSPARQEWLRVLPDLVKRHVLAEADLATVENYCLAIGIVRQCQERIAADGMLVETNTGPKRHPAAQTLFNAMTEARRLAAEIGLTPASRSKTKQASHDQGDMWADLDI